MPSNTTHPSYCQPAESVGKSKPATVGSLELSKNQTPLDSFVSSESVGVAKIYFPQELLKSPTIPVEVTFAELPEKSPAKIFVAAGAKASAPVSPAGSLFVVEVVAALLVDQV